MKFFILQPTSLNVQSDAPAGSLRQSSRSSFFRLIVLPVTCLLFFAPGGTSVAKEERVAVVSLTTEIVKELHGISISDAKPADLANAVRKLVERYPKQAAAIVAEVLAVVRPDMTEVSGLVVSAAIQGLGPDAPSSAVASIVRAAVQLQRSSTLTIVRFGARAVGNCDMVSMVVQSACEPVQAVVADGKNVVPLDGKDVIPVENKNVVPLDGKEIVPLQRDDKTVKPLDGKTVVVPATTGDEEIARAALEVRPDCFADVPHKTATALPTPPPILPTSTPTSHTTPQPTPPDASTFKGVIKSPAYIDPFPSIPSR